MNLADIIGNEESRLARFPIAREKIFLSHAAVTALPHCAAQAMADYAYSSCKDHQEFPEFMETMNETRRLSANLIGAEFSEIALMSRSSSMSFPAKPWSLLFFRQRKSSKTLTRIVGQ